MLGTRLVFGLLMVAGLVVALWVDEWFAPWYPFWLLICGAVMIAASRELVNLLAIDHAAAVGELGVRRSARDR